MSHSYIEIIIFQGGDQYVIWAYGHSDLNDFPASGDYHSRNRGGCQISQVVDNRNL